ncbi:hypothetical protein [Cohnella nanjingensis]|uniref:Uncharacterized protein n=1 Tax=Cohnella nanjingensis TaxID=1387779 RepID=A0A7X0RN57_9BACL|nr:hypothetical protein [Cohnella nanjingensis]MBB6670535.1 hypothetical protein [Cohnella nanjingensis]
MREQSELVARIYERINGEGYEVDIPALRALHPGLLTFEAWLANTEKAKLAAVLAG